MDKDLKDILKDIKRLLKYLVEVEMLKYGGTFPNGITRRLPDIRDILAEKEE